MPHLSRGRWVGSREAGPLGRPAFAGAASRRQAEVAPTPLK
jgi:hypothetical protein